MLITVYKRNKKLVVSTKKGTCFLLLSIHYSNNVFNLFNYYKGLFNKSVHQLLLESIVVALLLTVFILISRELNLPSPSVNREFKYSISGHSFIWT